jgi:hypothetical protein
MLWQEKSGNPAIGCLSTHNFYVFERVLKKCWVIVVTDYVEQRWDAVEAEEGDEPADQPVKPKVDPVQGVLGLRSVLWNFKPMQNSFRNIFWN